MPEDYRYQDGETDDTVGIVRTADQAFIPNNPDLFDWRAYQDWALTGTPDTATVPNLPKLRKKRKGDVDIEAEEQFRLHAPFFKGAGSACSLAVQLALAELVAYEAGAGGGGHGSLYVTGGASPQSLTLDVWTKLTQFSADGPSYQTTPAHASDQITLDVGETWLIAYQVSFTGQTNSEVEFAVAIDGVREAGSHCKRKLGTGSDVGSASGMVLVDATAAEVATLMVKSNTIGNLTLVEAQLTATRVTGDTTAADRFPMLNGMVGSGEFSPEADVGDIAAGLRTWWDTEGTRTSTTPGARPRSMPSRGPGRPKKIEKMSFPCSVDFPLLLIELEAGEASIPYWHPAVGWFLIAGVLVWFMRRDGTRTEQIGSLVRALTEAVDLLRTDLKRFEAFETHEEQVHNSITRNQIRMEEQLRAIASAQQETVRMLAVLADRLPNNRRAEGGC
jgi:hypothetical protein